MSTQNSRRYHYSLLFVFSLSLKSPHETLNSGVNSLGAFEVMLFCSSRSHNYYVVSCDREADVQSRDVRVTAEIRTLNTWAKNILLMYMNVQCPLSIYLLFLNFFLLLYLSLPFPLPLSSPNYFIASIKHNVGNVFFFPDNFLRVPVFYWL